MTTTVGEIRTLINRQCIFGDDIFLLENTNYSFIESLFRCFETIYATLNDDYNYYYPKTAATYSNLSSSQTNKTAPAASFMAPSSHHSISSCPTTRTQSFESAECTRICNYIDNIFLNRNRESNRPTTFEFQLYEKLPLYIEVIQELIINPGFCNNNNISLLIKQLKVLKITTYFLNNLCTVRHLTGFGFVARTTEYIELSAKRHLIEYLVSQEADISTHQRSTRWDIATRDHFGRDSFEFFLDICSLVWSIVYDLITKFTLTRETDRQINDLFFQCKNYSEIYRSNFIGFKIWLSKLTPVVTSQIDILNNIRYDLPAPKNKTRFKVYDSNFFSSVAGYLYILICKINYLNHKDINIKILDNFRILALQFKVNTQQIEDKNKLLLSKQDDFQRHDFCLQRVLKTYNIQFTSKYTRYKDNEIQLLDQGGLSFNWDFGQLYMKLKNIIFCKYWDTYVNIETMQEPNSVILRLRREFNTSLEYPPKQRIYHCMRMCKTFLVYSKYINNVYLIHLCTLVNSDKNLLNVVIPSLEKLYIQISSLCRNIQSQNNPHSSSYTLLQATYNG